MLKIWRILRCAPLAVFWVLASGCSGINTGASVSPATFLLPGLGKTDTPVVEPAAEADPTAHLLVAQSR
jgi:hypothetical protein